MGGNSSGAAPRRCRHWLRAGDTRPRSRPAAGARHPSWSTGGQDGDGAHHVREPSRQQRRIDRRPPTSSRIRFASCGQRGRLRGDVALGGCQHLLGLAQVGARGDPALEPQPGQLDAAPGIGGGVVRRSPAGRGRRRRLPRRSRGRRSGRAAPRGRRLRSPAPGRARRRWRCASRPNRSSSKAEMPPCSA